MNSWYDNLLGIGSTPNSTAANSALNGAASSNGSSWGSFLSGLVNLGTTGANAYATVAGAGNSTPKSTSTTSTSSSNWTQYLPWVLIGGGVLLVIALLVRRS